MYQKCKQEHSESAYLHRGMYDFYKWRNNKLNGKSLDYLIFFLYPGGSPDDAPNLMGSRLEQDSSCYCLMKI